MRTPNTESVRLYGLPGAEHLHFDPETVIEDWMADNDGVTEPFVIEEWSVHPPQYHLPDVERTLEWVAEYVADMGEVGEWVDSWDRPFGDAEVKAATQSLLDLIASKVTTRMANERLRDLLVTPSGDPENPLLDGEPAWRHAQIDGSGGLGVSSD